MATCRSGNDTLSGLKTHLLAATINRAWVMAEHDGVQTPPAVELYTVAICVTAAVEVQIRSRARSITRDRFDWWLWHKFCSV